ncbi:hypothetical protein [Aceticella autotrophica]|nr:hypothetical protein [Aceticella autotrophica]
MMKTFFRNFKYVPAIDNKVYEIPATKGDIALIYEEIIKIKFKIEQM